MDENGEDQGNKLQLWTLVLEIARFLMELGRLLLRAAKPITSREEGLQASITRLYDRYINVPSPNRPYPRP